MTIRFCLFLLTMSFLPRSACGSIYTDGEFFRDDWRHESRHIGGGARTFLASFRVTSPDLTFQPVAINGAYRFTHQVRGTNPLEDIVLASNNIYKPLVYDPSVSGPLAQLSMSYDIFIPSKPAKGSFRQDTWRLPGVSVWQNGHYFLHTLRGQPNDQWIHLAARGLTQSDFSYFGPLKGSEVPSLDFSSSGTPLQFGYVTISAFFQATSATHAVDNWRLELQSSGSSAVPEPGSLATLLGLLSAGGLVWQRRQRLRRNAVC